MNQRQRRRPFHHGHHGTTTAASNTNINTTATATSSSRDPRRAFSKRTISSSSNSARLDPKPTASTMNIPTEEHSWDPFGGKGQTESPDSIFDNDDWNTTANDGGDDSFLGGDECDGASSWTSFRNVHHPTSTGATAAVAAVASTHEVINWPSPTPEENSVALTNARTVEDHTTNEPIVVSKSTGQNMRSANNNNGAAGLAAGLAVEEPHATATKSTSATNNISSGSKKVNRARGIIQQRNQRRQLEACSVSNTIPLEPPSSSVPVPVVVAPPPPAADPVANNNGWRNRGKRAIHHHHRRHGRDPLMANNNSNSHGSSGNGMSNVSSNSNASINKVSSNNGHAAKPASSLPPAIPTPTLECKRFDKWLQHQNQHQSNKSEGTGNSTSIITATSMLTDEMTESQRKMRRSGGGGMKGGGGGMKGGPKKVVQKPKQQPVKQLSPAISTATTMAMAVASSAATTKAPSKMIVDDKQQPSQRTMNENNHSPIIVTSGKRVASFHFQLRRRQKQQQKQQQRGVVQSSRATATAKGRPLLESDEQQLFDENDKSSPPPPLAPAVVVSSVINKPPLSPTKVTKRMSWGGQLLLQDGQLKDHDANGASRSLEEKQLEHDLDELLLQQPRLFDTTKSNKEEETRLVEDAISNMQQHDQHEQGGGMAMVQLVENAIHEATWKNTPNNSSWSFSNNAKVSDNDRGMDGGRQASSLARRQRWPPSPVTRSSSDDTRRPVDSNNLLGWQA